MQAHKIKRHTEDNSHKCRMCAIIYPTKDSFDKHMKQHRAELNVGSTSQYPMNVYTFTCKPCNSSFKTHNDLMDHMCLVHLPKRNKEVQDASTYKKPSQANRPPPCRNGPQCRFHRQFWCSFFHSQPPQEQQYPRQQEQPRQPRQSPTNQWQNVASWRFNHQANKGQKTHTTVSRHFSCYGHCDL